ncbi:MAG TPA: transcription-repair coupling factor, partial [Bacteroidales bacterium]|nr:transcription-repair coupling factor [Bacteroidales bacterium]
EILIPNDYVNSTKERLSLYKELDNIENEEGLDKFRERLIDRFGSIPIQTQELINAVKLRKIAKNIGFEKIVLKGNKLIGFFIADESSAYYQTDIFSKVLNYVKENSKTCRMKEGNNKLTLAFENIKSISEAIQVLNQLYKIENKSL